MTLYAVIAAIVAIIGAIGGAFAAGHRAGTQGAAVKQEKANAQLQQKFDTIDAQKPDFDAAIDRLRKR